MRRYRNIITLAVLLLFMPVYVEAFWHGLSMAQSVFTTLLVNGGPGGQNLSSTGQDVIRMQCLLNNSTVDPVFSNSYCMSVEPTYGMADYTYKQVTPFTQAKTTFTGLSLYSFGPGAAQRTNFSNTQNCKGMGDCWGGVYKITYAGADSVGGDEGQGFWSDSNINQQNTKDLATVTSVVRATCSTTVTQPNTGVIPAAIYGSQTAQSVQVASSSTCHVNDWIIVDQQTRNAADNKEAVQITAVPDGTHITGIFRNNHLTSATITPATVFGLNVTGGLPGQMRVMIDLSSTPNTTGTVSSISGGTFTGSGTSWANNIVGGTATNIGCIALDADSYDDSHLGGGANFKSGTLQSWYQIQSITNTTSLGIFSFSALGNGAYFGRGPVTPPEVGSIQNPASTLQIRPCVELLYVGLNGSLVVGETTSTTWNVGDNVEIAISPFPDVSGMLWNFQKFTPGGQQEVGLSMFNASNVPVTIGVNLDVGGSMFKAASTTGLIDWHSFIPFTVGFDCGFCATGLRVNNATDAAIGLTSNANGGASFTGSISGNTLTVSGVSGSINAGNFLTSSPNATGTKVNPRTFIISGSGTTWLTSGPPQTVASQPMQSGLTDNGGRIDWNGIYIMPNSQNLGMDWQGVMSGTGGKLQIIANSVVAGGTGNLSSLTFSGMTSMPFATFASLGTCNGGSAGSFVPISDATVSTLNATITAGGGTNKGFALCNGTNWTFH